MSGEKDKTKPEENPVPELGPEILLTVTIGDLLDLLEDNSLNDNYRRFVRRLVNQVRPAQVNLTDPNDASRLKMLLGIGIGMGVEQSARSGYEQPF